MISLYDMLDASNGQLFGEPAAQLFAGFCLDASRAHDAELFVALKSDYGDTHQNMRAAVQKGVAGLLCSQPPTFDTDGVTVIIVKDTERAMLDWARFILAHHRVKPILVTGTEARATTVSAITAALGLQYTVHHQIDNAALGRLGIPLTLASLEPDCDFTVLEAVASEPGDIEQLVDVVQPQAAIVTAVGQSFLNRFKSHRQLVDEYAHAVRGLPADGLAVLNYNHDNIRSMSEYTSAHVLTVGIESFGADFMAYNIVAGPGRTGYDIRHGNRRYVGNWVPLAGRLQMYSAVFALATAAHYGGSPEEVLRTLTKLEPLPGRMNTFIGENGSLIVDHTYDATPDAIIEALNWLDEIKEDTTRAIFIFGDIDNLGSASRQAHRQIGQRAAQVADVIVTEGAQASLAGRAAQDDISDAQQVHIAYSIKDAIDATRRSGEFSQNDVILVSGGASSQMELVVHALLPNASDQRKLARPSKLETLTIQAERPMRPSWVEVDSEALAQNVRTIKGLLRDNVTLMATVKADAYGHGAVAVSRVALQNGASYLAVASMYEALELRDAGIDAPILVLSYTPVYAIREAVRHNITVTAYDLDLARAYNKVAKEVGSRLKVHVKIDTGMGRLGVLPSLAVDLFRHLLAMSNIEIEGIFTHFSVADENLAFTREQVSVFKSVLIPLRASGIQFKHIHVSNSAGTLLGDEFHFNTVRTGLLMYGYADSQLVEKPADLQPVLSWKTVVAQVKTLPHGHHIGYGNTYTTQGEERVAIIPVGYGDGLRRAPVNWGTVLVHGKRAPILGRVSMEKTVISLKHIDDVSVGDEVVLLGKQGDAAITAEDVAARLQTSAYEVLTSVLPRAPRR